MEYAVHNEGNTSHIAAVFKKGHQYIEHQNEGHKAQNGADTAENTVDNQTHRPIGSTRGFKTAGNQSGKIFPHRSDQAFEPAAGTVYAQKQKVFAQSAGKHDVHNNGKYGQSQKTVR